VFWALKNVSFSVEQGEVVGIIGRNGAGKSTLLKLLSRITVPDEGCITMRGRVASLLEVGTGFHPDLTGRENIFLNGSILGMKRAEIASKFDAIVAFSGIERFIDTPARRYSSGMTVRLAFAVAAHLEPEILLLDEVLAVGDIDFQRKCLSKMDEVTKKDGRTILFVSHQLPYVQNLCSRGILLSKGTIIFNGTASDAIANYLQQVHAVHDEKTNVDLNNDLKLVALKVLGSPIPLFGVLDYLLEVEAKSDCLILDLCMLIYNDLGQRISIADLRNKQGNYKLVAGEKITIQGNFADISLLPGVYSLGLFVRTQSSYKDNFNLCSFEVIAASDQGISSYQREHSGIVVMNNSFTASLSNPGLSS
jgi:lipopolysaccharide transport system ATP-binding protein